MPLVGSTALAELWARAKSAFANKIGVNAASTTVDVQLKNSAGTVLQTGTIPAATHSGAGVLTAADKSKLDGVASGANNYSLPTASASTLGGVKVGSNLSISNGVLSGTPNTTYSDMAGATTDAAGTHGLVPAPASGAANRYLRSDGSWAVPPDTNTTYSAATKNAAGLMSAADKAKLDGIATGATKVSVDTALSASSTNPVQNKVVNSALANKADTTATGSKLTATAGTTTVSVTYPGETTYTQVEADSVTIGLANSSGTELSSVEVVTGDKYVAGANIAITDHVISATYCAATGSSAGLMSAADKAKLDGVASNANKTTVDSAISATSTNPVQNKAVSSALAAKAPLASPVLTGTPTAPTAAAGANTAQIATTAFVTAAVTSAMASATQFQGTLTDAKQLTGASYRRGQYWVVKTAGTYASQSCEVGDMVFCISSKGTDYSSSDFSVVQNNVVEMTAAEVDSICV